MVFVALVMSLQPTSHAHLSSAARCRENVHVSACDLFITLDTHLRTNVQELLSKELLTLALIKQQTRWLLRVTALSEGALSSLHALVQACSLHSHLLVEQQPWVIEMADFTHSCWAGVRTWEDFLEPAEGRTVRLCLGTPLVVSTLHHGQNHPAAQFPHAFPIFTELAHRWKSLAGPALPGDIVSACEQGTCRVAEYRLQTLPVSLSQGVQPGFCGWITYECRADASLVIATVTALARFAFFAGVGSWRTQGMGTVRMAPVS